MTTTISSRRPHGRGIYRTTAGLLLLAAWLFTLNVMRVSTSAPFSSAIELDDASRVTPASPSEPVDHNAPSRSIRLGFVGDIMQHMAQASDDFEACYAQVKPIIQGFDLAVGNLEFPVRPDRPVGPPLMSAQFNGSLSHLDALAHTGFDLLCTANNHAFDQGMEGVKSTLDALEARGIIAVGTSRTQPVPVPVAVAVGGIRVGFVAYTFRPNAYAPHGSKDGQVVWWPREWPILELNFQDWNAEYRQKGLDYFRNHVQASRLANVDLLVALVHWGEEWHFQPSDDQRLAAHDMIDAGFDLVVGGHSHVLGPPEVYRNKLIAYSLGNFISDFVPFEARTGAVLEVTVAFGDQPPAQTTEFHYHPIQTRREGHVVVPLRGNAKAELVSAWQLSKQVLGAAVTDESTPIRDEPTVESE